MIKFLSILHQRCSGRNRCYLLWLWCSLFCCWCSCGSFLLVATTVCDAQNVMAWYVVYRGKEPGVYALKCLLAVLRATNQALKYLGYWLLLWFGRLFWWCLSFSLLSIVVAASNCFILPVMVSKCHENVWRQWPCEELWLLGNQSRPCSWFAGSTIVMFMSLEAPRSLSMPSLLNWGKVISVSFYSSSFCNNWW